MGDMYFSALVSLGRFSVLYFLLRPLVLIFSVFLLSVTAPAIGEALFFPYIFCCYDWTESLSFKCLLISWCFLAPKVGIASGKYESLLNKLSSLLMNEECVIRLGSICEIWNGLAKRRQNENTKVKMI